MLSDLYVILFINCSQVVTVFTILRDSPNKIQIPISSTINNENQIFQRNWFFFGILEWVLKESTNNKIANLSTKWVGQWGMVGYAHKKYKDNIF